MCWEGPQAAAAQLPGQGEDGRQGAALSRQGCRPWTCRRAPRGRRTGRRHAAGKTRAVRGAAQMAQGAAGAAVRRRRRAAPAAVSRSETEDVQGGNARNTELTEACKLQD